MPRPREVRDAFQKLIDDNNSAIRDLEKTIRTTEADAAPSEKLYATMIDRFAAALLEPTVDSDSLNALRGATGKDFEKSFRDQMTASREAEIRLNSLTATHGTQSALEETVRSFNRMVNEANDAHGGLLAEISGFDRKLKAVDAFNAKWEGAGKPLLQADGVDHFTAKTGLGHFFTKLFNAHYREGCAIARAFEGSIPETQKQRVESKAGVAPITQTIAGLKTQKAEYEAPLQEMRRAADAVVREETVITGVKSSIVKTLADAAVFDKAAAALPAKITPHLVEVRAKMEGFRKLGSSARKNIDGLKKASSKLEVHMPKLKKAVSRGATKNINVDLKQLKKGFTVSQTMARHKATEVSKASSSIRDYSVGSSTSSYSVASGPSALDFYMGFMIADMLSSHNDVNISTPDPHVINDSLGIPDSIATDIGINLDGLAPSLSDDAMSGLSGAFNDSSIGNIDVGNIDISVPDFSMPDISIPDISIPDISIDVGGGGMDFSGGGGGGDW
ncbi:MAG: hypothetical protein PW788_08860 [Micavibrio sp.]|nr:hypothetical protein [Micavibrio sp.]